MNKVFFLLTGMIFFLNYSCKKVDKLLTFTISNSTSFTVSSGTGINLPFDLPTPDVTTNSASDFENNNTKADLVKDVYLDELKLTITAPAGKNFDFLKAAHIYISLQGNDEIEIAYIDDIPTGLTTINLTTTKERLDKYIKESAYRLRSKVTTRQILTQDVTFSCDMKFKVTADPL